MPPLCVIVLCGSEDDIQHIVREFCDCVESSMVSQNNSGCLCYEGGLVVCRIVNASFGPVCPAFAIEK